MRNYLFYYYPPSASYVFPKRWHWYILEEAQGEWEEAEHWTIHTLEWSIKLAFGREKLGFDFDCF